MKKMQASFFAKKGLGTDALGILEYGSPQQRFVKHCTKGIKKAVAPAR